MKVNEAEIGETILNRIGAPQGAGGGFDYSPNRGAAQFVCSWDVPTLADAKNDAERVVQRLGRSWAGDAFYSETVITSQFDDGTDRREHPAYNAMGVIESLDVLVIAMIMVRDN